MSQMISLISILLMFFAYYRVCGACQNAKVRYGSMTGNKEIKVGSPIELTCILDSSIITIDGEEQYINASYLTFSKSDGSLIDAGKIHVVSTLQSKLIIESSKFEDSGLYYCVLSLENRVLNICARRVSIGDKPKNLDFKCISNYEKLHCKWKTEPPELKTESRLIRNSAYKISPIQWNETCPTARTGSNTWMCTWTSHDMPPFNHEKEIFEFYLVTNNSFGTKYDTYHLHHYAIVLPPKMKNLKAQNKAPSWIELVWNNPDEIKYFPPGLLCQIRHNSERKNNSKVIRINNGTETVAHNITDLIPHTLYYISVRCRSPNASESMWSEEVAIEVPTESDVPYISPNITKQAFEVKQSQHSRKIIIYWQEVPQKHWNGKGFHYQIICHQVNEHIQNGRAVNTNMSYASFDNLDPNLAYNFVIFSANNNGVSRNFANITVDRSEKLYNVPHDIDVMSFSNGSYSISWKPPIINSSAVKDYTLFWCNDCHTGSIDWKTVHANNIILNIPDYGKKGFQFAVAANSESSTSGMEWAICSVSYNNDPDKLQDFSIYTKNSTSLHVTWKLQCNAQQKIIKEFHIIYCRIESENSSCDEFKNISCVGKRKTKRVFNSSSDYYITGLVPSAWYCVNIQMIPSSGKKVKSEFKKWKTAYSEDLPSEMIVSIVAGSAVGFAILLIIVYMFIRWVKKKYDILKQIKVRLPTGLDTPNRCTAGTYQDFKKDLLNQYPYTAQIKKRPGSFTHDTKKNRHGSGSSQHSNISADEFLIKKFGRCDKYSRNPSGDSSSGCSSTEGHDSISSSNTNQTHISTDTGTEIDFLTMPVPDSVFHEQSPKSVVCAMPQIEMKDNDSDPTSDNGLKLSFHYESSEEGVSSKCGFEKNVCSTTAKNIPLQQHVYFQPYSKFGMNQIKDDSTNHYSRQRSLLACARHLANSEPSVADLDFGENEHFNCNLMPYSKLAFSKSMENLHKNSLGYSKCRIFEDNTVPDLTNSDEKLPHYTTINIYQNSERTEDINSVTPSKTGYVSIETCLENRNEMAKDSKILPLNRNVSDVNNSDSMAYSKLDIKPLEIPPTSLRENPKTGYIPIHQVNCMLHTLEPLPVKAYCPFDNSPHEKLCLVNTSLPAEHVVNSIVDPYVDDYIAKGLNSVPTDLCNNVFSCGDKIWDQEGIPTSLHCNGTKIDENQNTAALNKKESTEHCMKSASLTDININIHPQEQDKFNRGEQENLRASRNYLKEQEIVMSPRNLNYTTYIHV